MVDKQSEFESEEEDFYGSSRTFGPIETNANIYLIILWVKNGSIGNNLAGSFLWVWKDCRAHRIR